MRGLPLLLTALLLAGCVKQSSSYYINDRDHALTLRAEQQYLWNDRVTLTLTAARMPDCQRQFVLGELPIDAIAVELYSAGENVYNLRAGSRTWQVETGGCTQASAPDAAALGQPLGSFVLDESGKMVFRPAGAAAQ
jgi:hypothetical protein